jgi:hypothetical protein
MGAHALSRPLSSTSDHPFLAPPTTKATVSRRHPVRLLSPPPRTPPRAATSPPARAATLAASFRRHGCHQEPPGRAARASVHHRQDAPRPPPGRVASTRRQDTQLRRPGRQAGRSSLLHTVALMKKGPISFSFSF